VARAHGARDHPRQHGLRGAPPVSEHGDVRVPEAVDRLELVADDEDVLVVTHRKQVDELALESVGVLELVHHDQAESQLRLLAYGLVVAEQVTRGELKVLEVDD